MALTFGRFRFDRAAHRLADDGGPIDLNPKAFAVLGALLDRPGDLVSKEELLDAVWPDAHVSDGVVKVSIAELRRALGDSAAAPRFIATVHRRGYRFVAPVAADRAPTSADGDGQVGTGASLLVWPAAGVPGAGAAGLVGRGAALAELEARLARALAGERQVVLVTGEAGAGKTALVEQFVATAAAGHRLAVTGSQCLEQVGAAEAYMPVLEAIGRLARADDGVRAGLRRFAPTWLAQLPWLIADEDRERLGRELLGAARERMLREMAELLEALAADVPVVLVLDDLHWSDPSTVDLLALLAGRREPARLLVLATYRPAELVLTGHPLRTVVPRLAASRRVSEVALGDLATDAVADYLQRRFAGSRFPADVARLVRERSDGNPLFLVTLVDHLLARGAIVEHDGHWRAVAAIHDELAAVPESLRRLIEQQLERLAPEDRALLEAASLVGLEFSAAAAAVGAQHDAADAEARCDRLAAGAALLRSTGTAAWPDGTTAGAFAFRHALYREALASGVPARRRADIHLRVGETLERAYGVATERARGDATPQIAAELAMHFEAGGDRARAVRHRHAAAGLAATRHAFAEAETHLTHALALLAELPPSPEQEREELGLQSMLGAMRMATRGYAAPEVGEAYTRALVLSRRMPQGAVPFPVLWGIWIFYAVGGELDRALELAELNREVAEASGDRLLRLEAHHGLWTTHFFRGDLAAALAHLDAGEPLYRPEDRWAALVYGQDPKMAALGYRSLVLWATGHADRAVTASEAGVAHAQEVGHPMSIAQSMVFAAWIRACRREAEACRAHAEAVIAYANEHAMPFWLPNGLILRGWALVASGREAEGMADWERGAELWNALRGSLGRTAYDAMLVAARTRAGNLAGARALLERCKAHVAASAERYHEAEVHRIEADLVLAEAGASRASSAAARARADACLRASIECARRQGAIALELRAATALAGLHGSGDGRRDARARLGALLAALPEGAGTADVADARRILA